VDPVLRVKERVLLCCLGCVLMFVGAGLCCGSDESVVYWLGDVSPRFDNRFPYNEWYGDGVVCRLNMLL
jgi:hypothetical protein